MTRDNSCFGFAPHGIGITLMSWERALGGFAAASLLRAVLSSLGGSGTAPPPRSESPAPERGASAVSAGVAAGAVSQARFHFRVAPRSGGEF